MFSVTSSCSFSNTERLFKKILYGDIYSTLEKYGQKGVDALSSATPFESGETAGSWTYEIRRDATSWSIIWGNTHIVDGRPIAILLQYGHGTGTGGYVEGKDYINPALKPIFEQIKADFRRAVAAA